MIDEITESMLSKLLENGLISMDKVKDAREVIVFELGKYDITEKSTALVVHDQSDLGIIGRFFIAKATKGLAQSSMIYYKKTLKKAIDNIGKHVGEITTDDVRAYLTRQRIKGLNNTSLNNERRVLNSFFSWAETEDLIAKSPMHKIENIKEKKVKRKPFTEDEMERLRLAASDNRERAIIEFFFSTGCRVSEVSSVNIEDIDFDNRELVVVGKGSKERTVFLTPRCVAVIRTYLQGRKARSEALFVSERRPYERLTKSCLEDIVRKIGKEAGVPNVHPHRIRHTTATIALRRGMPIEQVSKMLGHEDLKTTTIYAKSTDDDVKQSHKKYIN